MKITLERLKHIEAQELGRPLCQQNPEVLDLIDDLRSRIKRRIEDLLEEEALLPHRLKEPRLRKIA